MSVTLSPSAPWLLIGSCFLGAVSHPQICLLGPEEQKMSKVQQRLQGNQFCHIHYIVKSIISPKKCNIKCCQYLPDCDKCKAVLIMDGWIDGWYKTNEKYYNYTGSYLILYYVRMTAEIHDFEGTAVVDTSVLGLNQLIFRNEWFLTKSKGDSLTPPETSGCRIRLEAPTLRLMLTHCVCPHGENRDLSGLPSKTAFLKLHIPVRESLPQWQEAVLIC